MNTYRIFSDVFEKYRLNYRQIFSSFYPSKNSTGFTERNLSVNFAKAYEQMNPSSITWFEFQFGQVNNLHYDALIIDSANKRILLIESKRFSTPNKKIIGVGADIDRIQQSIESYSQDFKSRIPDFLNYSIYGVVLADVWTETRKKKQIYDAFKKAEFVEVYLTEHLKKYPPLSEASYFVGDFADLPIDAPKWDILQTYHLVSFVWTL